MGIYEDERYEELLSELKVLNPNMEILVRKYMPVKKSAFWCV